MKGLLAAVSVVALLAAAPAWAQNTAHPSSQSLGSQDKTFMTKAGAGNLAEAELGKLALRKAATPAVKEFGRWMMTDHTLANKRLVAIGQAIGHPLHPMLTQPDISLKNKLEGLSGRRFDTQYMQAMVKDHKKDIKAFQMEAQDGQTTALKTYAHTMLPVLKEHLAEAEQLTGGGGVAMSRTGLRTSGSGSSIQHYNR